MLMNSENKPVAEIENWYTEGDFLFGKVTKHANQMIFKTDLQQTSPIQEIDLVNGFAETENTFYILKTPRYLSFPEERALPFFTPPSEMEDTGSSILESISGALGSVSQVASDVFSSIGDIDFGGGGASDSFD